MENPGLRRGFLLSFHCNCSEVIFASMLEEINSWIASDHDFNEGLALYQKYGRSKSLLRVINGSGPSPKNLNTLIYELSRSAGIPETGKTPNIMLNRNTTDSSDKKHPVVDKPAIPGRGATADFPRRENTAEIDQLIQEKTMLLKEWDSLHATLELVDKQTCRINALRILDIGDILDDMYNRLDHYNKHAVLPPGRIFPVRDYSGSKPFDVFKRRSTLKTYISRENKLIKDARTKSVLIKHRNLLAKYQLELNDIEKKIEK